MYLCAQIINRCTRIAGTQLCFLKLWEVSILCFVHTWYKSVLAGVLLGVYTHTHTHTHTHILHTPVILLGRLNERVKCQCQNGSIFIVAIFFVIAIQRSMIKYMLYNNLLCTIILEIFAVINNSLLKETTKIKHSKILFQRIFTTANFYGLLKLWIINYNEN